MLDDQALSRALERAGVQAPVRFDEVTPSTQETARRMAEGGAPEWTLVAAGHQTHGRGRLGRVWHDEPGRALMFSLVLRPDLAPDLGGLLTLLAGVALVRACAEVGAGLVTCRWPNDLLVEGRKAGGILAESRLSRDRFEHVVLGVGVNLWSPPADLPQAGALPADDEALLAGFLRAFVASYRPTDEMFPRAVMAAYRGVCATIGTRVRARTSTGAVVEGEAVDVDGTGALVVAAGSGTTTVRFGEVERLE